jgi:16S rRNA (cytidine1402-2'-O)-methyltransferase
VSVSGTLFVVATPLGNLGDLSPRAIETLRSVALIAAEDTRHSGLLLQHFGIHNQLVSLHKFNERARLHALLDRLAAGESIALISDGGTPTISDPGYRLVEAAHRASFPVRTIPGPCAVAAALSVSGLPADRYEFFGFVPTPSGQRAAYWQRLLRCDTTAVLFEAPHRLARTLRELPDVIGTRTIVLCRELTKLHEQVQRGTAAELAHQLDARAAAGQSPKGEIVLVIAGGDAAPPVDVDPDLVDLLAAFARALAHQSGDIKLAIARLAKERAIGRLELKQQLTRYGALGESSD